MSDLTAEEERLIRLRAITKYERLAGDGDIDFDDEPVISAGEDGAYVQCWVWVNYEDAGITEEEEDDELE